MKEYGGYIELDTYGGDLLHGDAVQLNCGRRCLTYLIRARKIRKIMLPRFICDSVTSACIDEGVQIRWYGVDFRFHPLCAQPGEDEWLYLVNYYGQISNEEIVKIASEYPRLIVDNAQAYFRMPVPGVDTLYTCRKYFGVADGAFLYTDAVYPEKLPRGESYDRIGFLVGRFERSASEFYDLYRQNNAMFSSEPVRKMSRLTENMLRALDYKRIKKAREDNFAYLYRKLASVNELALTVPDGAFMYPLMVRNGREIRKRLQAEKIYVPLLWPDVFARCRPEDPDYRMAADILPLPVDQRYGIGDMEAITGAVMDCIQ
ncbi:MAG: hypothetical protein IKP22_10690 [Clostridia bacterium]|nr:hypothetical protein [Clostridia bacterium]